MKKYFLLILLPIFIGCTNRNNVSITGTLENGDDSKLYLEFFDSGKMQPVDSVKIKKNGQFAFHTFIENPELCVLRSDNGNIINLLISPDEKVKLDVDYKNFAYDYELTGSPESEKIKGLVLQLSSTRHKLDSIENEIIRLGDTEGPQLRLLQSAYNKVYLNQKRYNIRYIIENITSLSSVYALFQKLNNDIYILGAFSDLQYYKIVYDSISVYYPDATLTQLLKEDIEFQEQRFNESQQIDKLLAQAEERGVLPISLPDVNGDTIRFHELTDRVVLLIFWSSIDEPSIRTLLDLKNTYSKYHDAGFEIYAVSLDSNKDQWETTLRFNQFNWINVSELSYPNSITDKNYNVYRLPTSFLINREGAIVTRDIYGRNLEIWLDNLL